MNYDKKKDRLKEIKAAGFFQPHSEELLWIEDVLYGSLWQDGWRGSLANYLKAGGDFWGLLNRGISRLGGQNLKAGDLQFSGDLPNFPAIGIGTYGWKYDTVIMERALDKGVSFIDTGESYGYGKVEKVLGGFLRRDGRWVTVASKFAKNHNAAHNIQAAAKRSRLLFPEEIRFHYQCHYPLYQFPLGTTIRTMKDLVLTGKVDSLGVCNFSADMVYYAQSILQPHTRLLTNQVRYSLFDRRVENYLLPWCKEHGVLVIAHSPLGQNLSKMLRKKDPDGVLIETARSNGCSVSQVLLSWLISKGVMPIPQTNNLKHMEENLEAVGLKLPKKDVRLLERQFPSDTDKDWWRFLLPKPKKGLF